MTGRFGKLRFMIGRRPDISTVPLGFWFGWHKADGWNVYQPAKFLWKFGCSFGIKRYWLDETNSGRPIYHGPRPYVSFVA